MPDGDNKLLTPVEVEDMENKQQSMTRVAECNSEDYQSGDLSKRCVSESTLCSATTGNMDLVNQDSCETVTLKSASSGLCIPQDLNDSIDDEDHIRDSELDTLDLQDMSRTDLNSPHKRETDDSSPISLSCASENSSSPSEMQREHDQEAADILQQESVFSPVFDHAQFSSTGSSAHPTCLPTTESVVIPAAKTSTQSSIMSSSAIEFPSRSVALLPSNGSRPDTLSFSYGASSSYAPGGVMGGNVGVRRIVKKESYSSLSEYSSRSNSMDFLIEAATSTPLHAQGTVDVEGDQMTFVADGINELIKRSRGGASCHNSSMSRSSSVSSSTSGWSAASASAVSRATRSPSVLTGSPDDIPPVDPKALLDLEVHARRVAGSLDHMVMTITKKLHKMSLCTYHCVDVYKEAVDTTCDSVDASIKSMYALMAKCEELSKSLKPVYQVQDQVKEIKRLLDLFEAQLAYDDT